MRSPALLATALIGTLIGCNQSAPNAPTAPEIVHNTAAPLTAEEQAKAIADQAELNAQIERERQIEAVRQRDPALNWINIGITTGKFSESIGSSVHKTYDECTARSAMEDNECFPIPALPRSYWKDAQPLGGQQP